MNRKAHLPHLTGIRSVAFGMVFAFHAGFPSLFLWSGVDLFFVLSGFLITGILLSQSREDHYFRTFYTRRFLRIFPPFYAVLVFSVLVLGEVNGWHILSIGAFYANIYMPFTDPASAPPSYWAIGPYWSLALEEQFYLLWPLLVFMLSPRRLLRVCVFLIVAAPVARGLTHLLLFETGVVNYQGVWMLPWNRLDLLAAGAAVAIVQHLDLAGRETMARLGFVLTIGCAALILCTALSIPTFRISGESLLFSTLGYSAFCGMMSGAIMYLANSSTGPVIWLLSLKPVVYCGTISYTMYLLHGTIISVVGHQTGIPPGWRLALVCFVITFALAAMSWHLMEQPIQRFKNRAVR